MARKKTDATATVTATPRKGRTPAPAAAPVVDPDARPMNKQQFISDMAEATWTKPSGETEPIFGSKAQTRRALEAFLDGMLRTVRGGGAGVSFTGYFSVRTKLRSARKNVRVPSRGDKSKFEFRDIPEKVVPKLTAGVKLKVAAAND